jgi:hypothetical protein
MQVALLFGLFLGTLGNSPAIKEDIESEIDYTDGEEAALAKSKSNEFVFVVEHSMGKAFSPRGGMTVSISQLSSEASVQIKDNYKFSSDETQAFKALLENHGFYKVRIRSDPANEKSPFVMASLQACQLLNSNFEEVFTLHLDKKRPFVWN